jgi:hypothetical protein
MAGPIEIPQVGQTSIQKATGPRSKGGKERSSRNAIKHAIFSDVIVLPTESREKYQSLVSELWETLQPVGKLEEVLVEKLATLIWRHRRLLVAEGAEIRNGSEFWEWDKENRKRQEVVEDEVFQSDPALILKIQDPEKLDGCLESLGYLREEIDSGALDRERDTSILKRIYGPTAEFRKTFLETYLVWLGTAETSEEERQREGYATPEGCKENILIEIDKEIRRLGQYQRKHAAIESQRAKLEVLRRNVPEPARLDRLLRYEGSLERALARTLNQLERIQRLRRGQSAAPRIEIDVSN